MYSEAELQGLRGQIRRRLIALAAFCAPLLAGVIAGFVLRSQVLADVCAVAAGALLIAGLDLSVGPLWKYARHVETMLDGHSKVSEGVYQGMEAAPVLVDGVSFRPLTLTTTDPESGKTFAHLYYYDCEKPLPDWQPGQTLRVTHVGRSLIGGEPV